MNAILENWARRDTPPVLAPLVEEHPTVALDLDPQLWSNLQCEAPLALEGVFAKLPFRFFFQARLVCKEWNRLASDEKFLEENVVPPAFLMRPHFCLMHPGGDWQIILTYNVAADEWHQMHMPLPYRIGYRANWVDGFLHISWPENESVKHVVLNLRTRMKYILPPQDIPEELTGYNCVEGLVVNKCRDKFQVVSGRGHLNRFEEWHTSIYGSESKRLEGTLTEPAILVCGKIMFMLYQMTADADGLKRLRVHL